MTRIVGANLYEDVLKKDFKYNEDVRRRVNVTREFEEQKRLAEELHHRRSVRLISDAIEGINKFVSKSLQLDGPGLFERQRDQLHGETLFLDMHISDHEMTFAMIEKSVKKLVTNLHVLRLKANLARKRSIPELMEPSKQSRRIFIIVEQAECLSRNLTNTLVGYLKNRLSDETSPTDAVMILFCLSIKIQTLPFDNMHCFGRMKGISKHSEETSRDRLNELLRSRNLKVKLAPDTLDFINIHSLNADSSITSICFLHCYCIFEHYQKLEEEDLLSKKEFEKLEYKHQALCDDIQCYARFLEEKDVWPEDVSDIYEELGRLDDLSLSTDFFNAIHGVRKIPHDRLVKRLQRVEDDFAELIDHKKQTKRNALTIMLSYKEKIINNKDDKDVVAQLIDDLMKYARNIRCPFNEHPNFYYNDRKSLIRGCFSSSRNYNELVEMRYLDQSTFFGILFSKILQSPGQIAAGELCEEVLPDFKELIKRTRKSVDKKQSSAPSPPKRSRRLTTIRASRKCDDKREDSSDEIDGLARALFVDVIDCMEHQGIVKLDARAKGKIIKRLAWPVMTKDE